MANLYNRRQGNPATPTTPGSLDNPDTQEARDLSQESPAQRAPANLEEALDSKNPSLSQMSEANHLAG